MSWREALPEPPGLAGSVVLNSRNESEEVKDIVENVTRLVDMTDLIKTFLEVSYGNKLPSHHILEEKILQNMFVNGFGGFSPMIVMQIG
ncbi:hypothetical protein P8452_58790 [Trifolium repens]|nr:hypothetical protein P8452_58790 [Trifolium repens]